FLMALFPIHLGPGLKVPASGANSVAVDLQIGFRFRHHAMGTVANRVTQHGMNAVVGRICWSPSQRIKSHARGVPAGMSQAAWRRKISGKCFGGRPVLGRIERTLAGVNAWPARTGDTT